MKTFVASLVSASPYSQSRAHVTPKLEKETADDHEQRTWRERCHYLEDGTIFIPPTSFKECLSSAAKYLSVRIPGKGQATYTKHFLSGIMVMEQVPLPIKKDEIQGERLFLNADGKKGGNKRVWRTMPVVHKWAVDVNFYVLDDTITLDVFRYHLEQAGAFIGIGRFRPQNGGFYGRFTVKDVIEA